MLARLDPQNELNALRSAQATLSAAEGKLVEASNTFDRQKTLLPQGFTTQVLFDQAQQALRTAQSNVDNAQAQLHIAKDRVSYTTLKAGVAGSVTARTAEAGEVVQAGQMVFQVARQDGRDAVFDVPAQVIRSAPADPEITVSLTDDRRVTAMGRVRRSIAAGRPGHADLPGARRPDRPAAGDVAGRHGQGPHGARRDAEHLRAGHAPSPASTASRPSGWSIPRR